MQSRLHMQFDLRWGAQTRRGNPRWSWEYPMMVLNDDAEADTPFDTARAASRFLLCAY
jgi:hypothetical protein